MTTDYDPIAEAYQRAKQQPWRAHVEAFTLMGLVGDLSGKSVIDIACGEGFYTRLLRKRGAARVVGVDLSPRMVELAEAQEAEQKLGIDYRVADGKTLPFDSEFDVAFAAYFLNYAHDRAELQAMCDAVSRCLKPGGRFVTVNCNPMQDFSAGLSYRKYGFEARLSPPLREGAPIVWSFFLEDGSFEIENYFLDARIHEDAFRSAGFREIRWPEPRLSEEGAAVFGQAFWSEFLEHPAIAFIECVK